MVMLPKLMLIYGLMLSLFGCGQSDDAKESEVFLEVNYHLSSLNCSPARSSLSGFSGSPMNPTYIEALAAVDACDGGFSVITFFADDIPNLDPTAFFSSMGTFSTANETQFGSITYEHLRSAIFTITHADQDTPLLADDRNTLFGQNKGEDLSLFALYMNIAFLGKWFQLYGNLDSDGVKGAGSFNNNCFIEYTNPGIAAIIQANSTGSCDIPYVGSPGLDLVALDDEVVIERVCDLTLALNHIFDILGTITLSSNSSLGSINDLRQGLQDIFDQANAYYPGINNFLTIYSVSECVDAMEQNLDILQAYLAAVAETNVL